MPPDAPSNVRVFVEWRDQTVFAGEEIRCTITFKNVAPEPTGHRKQHRLPGDRQRLTTVPLNGTGKAKPTPTAAGLTSPPAASSTRRHHRSALSLNGQVASPSHSRIASMQWPQTAGNGDWRPGHAHKRSVSIVSIGSSGGFDEHAQRREANTRLQSSRRGHNRAASLQIPPRVQPLSPSGPQSASLNPRHMSSPLVNAPYLLDRFGRSTASSTAPNTPGRGLQRSPMSQLNPMPEFKFPAEPAPDPELQPTPTISDVHDLVSRQPEHSNRTSLSLRPKEHAVSSNEHPAARVLSSNSISGGTPRSSGDFYSLSNHSSETLASEYVTRPLVAGQRRTSHLRPSSSMPSQHPRTPESLMMGYAQIHGSFTLDGSLVSLGPFEQVKKKAAVGMRGGGVVGLDPSRRESGLLRGFGWSSISNSLGDLWGGDELSTIKEMRGAINARSVPLLSTPQSILFVEMQLEPGESRAFEYSFSLPRGLPPSHKGKAIKFSYSLVIGTQRAGGAKEQNVRCVEIPFRVLGSVNGYGEILGHDLMNPHVLLRDEAKVKSLEECNRVPMQATQDISTCTQNDFLNYVDELAAKQGDGTGGMLLSPTESSNARRSSVFEEVTTTKDAIHSAIMRSNVAGEGQQSPNRFEIARNGQRIGVVMLTRPAYKLGEVITMAIDFTNADVPCYAVHATLETSEKVDLSLAMRSEASIQRVTRKIYMTWSEAVLSSRRTVFTPTIPITATPDFVTSGVSLEWKIRVEFVVGYDENDEASPREMHTTHPLLEQISQDERGGLVLVAVENLACESFDVCVPLRVYGAVCNGLERLERDEASEEGLVV
ncbi:hypothetical protein CDD81_4083 [Ophiocordyceps australis]|uniref:Rgp1-domain-containing protein n=1 Tax=Ophiocordyceps australis TaxID=1399860 RepID=A0A2C5XU61_9HYPO|nr:hypothetical protein CDD81_4083 [Ophiocordyceps australis]